MSVEIVRITPSLPQGEEPKGASPLDPHERLDFSFTLPNYYSAMLHGANPEEAVSARGPIAIRYRSLFKFSNEHDSTEQKNPKKIQVHHTSLHRHNTDNYYHEFFCFRSFHRKKWCFLNSHRFFVRITDSKPIKEKSCSDWYRGKWRLSGRRAKGVRAALIITFCPGPIDPESV